MGSFLGRLAVVGGAKPRVPVHVFFQSAVDTKPAGWYSYRFQEPGFSKKVIWIPFGVGMIYN